MLVLWRTSLRSAPLASLGEAFKKWGSHEMWNKSLMWNRPKMWNSPKRWNRLKEVEQAGRSTILAFYLTALRAAPLASLGVTFKKRGNA